MPREWTLPFLLVPSQAVAKLCIAGGNAKILRSLADAAVRLAAHTGHVIFRSSVIGETIWERGTFLSESLPSRDLSEDRLLGVIRRIVTSAPRRAMALVVQAYCPPDESGECGNLMRLSKTRDHWELSLRDPDGITSSERFNSQRSVAPSITEPLEAQRGLPRSKLFASVAAWTNNELLRGSSDRVSFEWVRGGSKFYLVQLDREDEDTFGVNPLQVFIESTVVSGSDGTFLKVASLDDRAAWDKLAVLDELYDDGAIVPTLYLLPMGDCKENNRATLEADFRRALGGNIVIRTTGREKITNLKKTDCLTPVEAAGWVIEQAQLLSAEHVGIDLAFIAHRYIAARACAWVRASPDNPTVEVHGNWGLPDALQFCPYDIWEVHIPTEEVTEYPAYKSNVLLLNPDGSWRYERVKNEVARFQSLTKIEVIELSARTAQIARKLGKSCHVMWFVGCKDADGGDVSIPWYWTEAHDVSPPDKRTFRIFDVVDQTTLSKVPALPSRYGDLAIRLIPDSGDLLRDNAFLRKVADVVVPLKIPVILTGSTLAHAFFQLTKHGCTVIPAGEKEHVRIRKQMTFGKLVRDKIPDRIAEHQEKQRVATIPVEYRLGYLVGKLVEEAIEVRAAAESAERVMEIADVYEVIRALVALEGKTLLDVEAAANAKRQKAGGFDHGHLLVATSIPAASDDALSTQEALLPSPALYKVGEGTINVPFASFGFMEVGQSTAMRLDGLGLWVRFTMRSEFLEISVSSVAQQLELGL
jgi:predicted house-cleaning noncanonical NTP pyrophosphatase (MazG superfamily)